ncbi:MAG: twin-arginine translocase TatA/TatE family subunit [Planctomycetota bacterium]
MLETALSPFFAVSRGLVSPAFIQGIGWMEVVVILAVGVLIFGGRLPEVGKNIGKAIVEFKKGVKGVTEEIDAEASRPTEARKIDQASPAATTPAATTTSPADQQSS